MLHTQITDENFKEEVENTEGMVLLDFYAVWCGPCKMLSPILDDVAAEYPTVKLCKCDVDEAGALAQKFGIQSIPTVFFFKDGKPVYNFIGYREKEEIVSMLQKVM